MSDHSIASWGGVQGACLLPAQVAAAKLSGTLDCSCLGTNQQAAEAREVWGSQLTFPAFTSLELLLW